MLKKVADTTQQRELGFGKNLTDAGRLMRPDGQFNVIRENISRWDNLYYWLITISGWQFLLLMLSCYIAVNALFAGIYLGIGIERLTGITPGSWDHNFMAAYFFSSQTLTTVGYGHISPNGWAASMAASLESFVGLLFFALISGLLYGRFSRPAARILFSEKMLVAPYRDGQTALMFRMVNARRSELVEAEIQVTLAINQRSEAGHTIRRFYSLELEIPKINFFNLSWTIVHVLSDKSPLSGFSLQDYLDGQAEFLILVKATEDTNQQQVNTRRSYTGEEMVWNAKFKPIIGRTPQGVPLVYTRQVGDYELL